VPTESDTFCSLSDVYPKQASPTGKVGNESVPLDHKIRNAERYFRNKTIGEQLEASYLTDDAAVAIGWQIPSKMVGDNECPRSRISRFALLDNADGHPRLCQVDGSQEPARRCTDDDDIGLLGRKRTVHALGSAISA
jgi:hypothetical protein